MRQQQKEIRDWDDFLFSNYLYELVLPLNLRRVNTYT
jgi:hypothetical protein